VNLLAIGGSDPSSGAGIQSNIKAASVLGANCFTVVTAITSQNSQKFSDVEPVTPKSIEKQLDSILSDFRVDAITIGMVYDSKIIESIYHRLNKLKIPIIVDPVIKSTTGGVLLKKSAFSAFKRFLVPLALVITPNVYEAETLSGIRIKKYNDLNRVAKKIASLGAKNVVITGHEFEKNKIGDFVYDGIKSHSVFSGKIPGMFHGSGCNFAIALSYAIAQKNKPGDAVEFAKKFTYESIKSSQGLGHGIKITSPREDMIKTELAAVIQKFTTLDGVNSLIPEVQTNFVYAKPNSKSLNDIVGVSGRIVKAGKDTVIAGRLEYGGSRHVGTAMLTVQKKFPQIRSAANIKFDERLVKKLQNAKYKVLSYDRSKEPRRIKLKENSTISWGIHNAIKNHKTAPDAVYHKGDVGKEPMIIVFGKHPNEVMVKISKLLDA
jgi:hydroxymethylpyrimidine/phosphomethylpyrimidine kinase